MLPYLVEIVLLVLALLGLLRLMPADAGTGERWRPRRPSVPAPIRRTFAVAGVSAFLAWAVTALFLALIPSFVTSLLHTGNLASAGGVVALMLGCSTLAQLVLRRLPSLGAQSGGLVLLIAGLVGIVAAARNRAAARRADLRLRRRGGRRGRADPPACRRPPVPAA